MRTTGARPMDRVALAAIVLVSFAGCKTSKTERSLLDGEAMENVEVQPDEFASIPPSLWPPSQRQATAGYYYLVGESMVLNGDLEKSVEILDTAYNLDPNPFLGQKLIAAKLQAGRVDEVLTESKRMVLLYPKSPELRRLYGQILYGKGLGDEAIEELKHALKLAPDSEESFLQLISAYQAQGMNIEAEKVARDLTAKQPDSVAGWSLLSRLQINNGNSQQALIAAKRAYDLQSASPELTLIYAYTLELNKQTREAVQLYERLFRLNPTNQEIVARMVRLYREIGGIEEALELLNEMVASKDADKPGVHLHRAYLLWELNRFAEASSILGQLVVQHPEDDRLRYLAGLGYEKIEKFENALELYHRIPEDSPFWTQAAFREVVVLQGQKRIDEALRLASKLTSAKDAEWEAFALEAALQSDLGKHDEAIKRLDEGIQRFPDVSRLFFLRGVNQEKAGKIADCIVSMRKVIELDPANSAAYNYLGYLYAERGENLNEAESLILKALELKPGDGYFLDSLGWVYFQKKDYKKALAYLKKAAEASPNEGVILEHIGDAYHAQGRKDLALKYYRDASSAKGDERDLVRIKAKLAELERENK